MFHLILHLPSIERAQWAADRKAHAFGVNVYQSFVATEAFAADDTSVAFVLKGPFKVGRAPSEL
jgi:hypothetical protein